MAHRYFLDKIDEDKAYILGDEAKHLIKVMRIKMGEDLILSDEKGFDYFVKVQEINQNEVVCTILSKEENKANPKKNLTVFMALPKSDKLEFITQKLCELGVSDLIPFESEFCIAKKSKKDDSKLLRLQKISKEAAKQAGRSVPMNVLSTLSFKEFLKKINTCQKVLIFYEKEATIISQLNLEEEKEVAIIIGSEGGFSKEEIDLMIENGAIAINLGKRILRCETAAITAASLIQYKMGEFE